MQNRFRPPIILFLIFSFVTLFSSAEESEPRLTNATFKGLEFRGIGPALMSGRIADLAIHPIRKSTWYVAVGSGGVWKTVNRGTTWEPIFDDQTAYSVGCVTLDPSNPEIVWVGTGENVSGRHVGFGDGVYKSLNAGETWSRMGLEKSEHIAKILIEPKNGDTIYVAAEGPLWTAGGERGVFKSTDGGRSWELVLEISADTGITDLEFSPDDPQTLYAAAYQRRRTVAQFLGGGPESGIYKSTDSGKTWRRIERGLPKGDMGKIGLAVSVLDPSHVYATIEASDREKGFYLSTDRGESWEKRNAYISGGTGAHYYQEIYASPHKLDRVYQMDVRMRITEDGGKTFGPLGEQNKHSDNHALAFDANDPDYLLCGTDGGIYETFDHGKTWRFIANLPVTQFYKMALDNALPFYNVVGGTQDNSSQHGPSRTKTVHGIRNQDWIITLGADGHGSQIDPEDPNIVYSEMQSGRPARFDRATGERLDIQPRPQPGDDPERWNWDAPILISPHLHTRLYYGSQRLWRTDDRGDSWTPISPDLTRNQNRYELPIAGRVWSVNALWDHSAMSIYNTTTSISESPLVESLIYVGTDDGLIQVTEDGGRNWRRIDSLPGVAEYFYVNEVKASVTDPDTVFVAVDQHKIGDYQPYLFRSADRGKTWSSITGNLPERHLVWSVVQDHVNPELLLVGTEFGIFFTLNGGEHWIKFEGGLPPIPFRDLEIQRRENDLVGASFGRGFYILDDYSALRDLSEEKLHQQGLLFPTRKALLYIEESPLIGGEKADQGASYFTAPNPPFGAVFTYYLGDSLQTMKQIRADREKAIRKEGGNVPFPGWNELLAERSEEAPQIVLTVTDSEGNMIRHLPGPSTRGFHRVAWDLRYPGIEPIQLDEDSQSSWNRPSSGPLVLSGRFSVTLSKLVDGKLEPISPPQEFEVAALGGSTLPVQDPQSVLNFQLETADLMRRALAAEKSVDEAETRIRHIRKALLSTPEVPPDLMEEARRIEVAIADLKDQLDGDPVRRSLSEARSPGFIDRLRQIARGHWQTTYGPTQTHRRDLEIAQGDWEVFYPQYRQIVAQDLVRLEESLERAGAPHTPGRTIP